MNGKAKLKTIKTTIRGRSPLMCNRFTDDEQMSASTVNKSSVKSKHLTPREQAEERLYIGESGKPVIPQPNLLKCFIDAGKFFKHGRSKITTQRTSLVTAFLEIEGREIPIIHNQPWSVDSRPIRNPVTGGKMLKHRPRFDDWELEFVITLNETIYSINGTRDLIDTAGCCIGLGDFRIDCKGGFGKFEVIKWDIK